MPELPDVEATRRYLLTEGIRGRSFTDVTLHWPKAVRCPTPEEFRRRLVGRTIRNLGRRGKFLLFDLDRDTLVVHLRMTGSLVVASPTTPPHKLTRTQFDLDNGRRLLFIDGRKLGAMWLVPDSSAIVDHLGPEPLDKDFTAQVLAERLEGRSAPIKPLLLEQDLVAGIGNIYADEALFVSGINPMRRANSLSFEEIGSLHGAIRTVLVEAIEKLTALLPVAGPPTESREGGHVLHMPRSQGARCTGCGGQVSRQVIRGRSAYYCPVCQPAR